MQLGYVIKSQKETKLVSKDPTLYTLHSAEEIRKFHACASLSFGWMQSFRPSDANENELVQNFKTGSRLRKNYMKIGFLINWQILAYQHKRTSPHQEGICIKRHHISFSGESPKLLSTMSEREQDSFVILQGNEPIKMIKRIKEALITKINMDRTIHFPSIYSSTTDQQLDNSLYNRSCTPCKH